MKNTLKNNFYAASGLVLSSYADLSFATDGQSSTTFGVGKASTTASLLEKRTLDDSIQRYVNYLMTFLYLIAVLYALWGGFLILTAAGDDEKVSKGKKILIQGGIGLLVIWLSGTIVQWILSVLIAP